MPNPWHFFPFVALLTVQGNDARVADFLHNAAQLGLDPSQVRPYVFRKNGFGTNSVDREVLLAHQYIMRDALAVGAPHALIFEDDSRFFADATQESVQKAVQWLASDPQRWDLFFLGCFHTLPSVPVARGVEWTPAPLLSHAYAIKAESMRQCLTHYAEKRTFRRWLDHIDFYLARAGLRKYAAAPQLCYQCEVPRDCPIKLTRDFGIYQRASDHVWVFWIMILLALVWLGRRALQSRVGK